MDIQKAGDNSQQFQIGNITIGLDEKRVREICDEKFSQVQMQLTSEATRVAKERVDVFGNKLIEKIKANNERLNAFADPGFQFALVDAQKSAAASDRPEDYDLLTELLIHRIEKGKDRNVKTGIHKAIQIVQDISDEALLGLTIVHIVERIIPISRNLDQGLTVINNMFDKFIHGNLPMNNDWLDHLDILNAIRLIHFSKLNQIDKIYTNVFSGFTKAGILRDSDNHKRAIDILKENGIPEDMIVDNVLKDDYVRINLRVENDTSDTSITNINFENRTSNPFTNQQKSAIKSIYDLYSKDASLDSQVKMAFLERLHSQPNIALLKEWWDKIPYSFTITSVGKVLAHANAQRIDNTIPPLND